MSDAPKHAEGPDTHQLLGDKTYNQLKWFTLIVLPAFGTFYFSMAQLWDLPKGPEVSATVTGLVTFFGIVLGISTRAYNLSKGRFDGDLNIMDGEEGRKVFQLDLSRNPEALGEKDEVRFKVNR